MLRLLDPQKPLDDECVLTLDRFLLFPLPEAAMKPVHVVLVLAEQAHFVLRFHFDVVPSRALSGLAPRFMQQHLRRSDTAESTAAVSGGE